MKVLMFGWEFPPHISGGLGTACFGLTRSLLALNTDILFVIPKANAEPYKDRFELISASEISIAIPEQKPDQAHPALETIEVSSSIKAYSTPQVLAGNDNMLQWDYQFPTAIDDGDSKKRKLRYQFSGSYGPNLMEEVERYALVAREIVREKSFDVIHAHDWLTYPAGMAAKKISGKPLVAHMHATEYDRAGEGWDPKILRIEREGMEAADVVVAVSQLTKDVIVNKYHIPEHKVVVVHNGILAKQKVNSVQSANLLDKRIITFLGRVTFQKGPEYFIDAAAKVLQKFPDVHFVMAGSGDLLPEMIARAARLRISSHVHFTGFLPSDRVEDLLSMTHIYVMPSVSEPFGIAPLEAIRAGVPVIISNHSGVAEVLQHAIKVDFWNTEALADAMCNLLKYKSLSNMLKTQSKQELTNITWKQAAKKVNAIYHELTHQS